MYFQNRLPLSIFHVVSLLIKSIQFKATYMYVHINADKLSTSKMYEFDLNVHI